MKKLNNKGFGIIEGLLILVVLAIVGSIGIYVYKANKNTDKSSDRGGVKELNDESTIVDENKYTDWVTVNNKEFGYSYKHPDKKAYEEFYLPAKENTDEYRQGQRVSNAEMFYHDKSWGPGSAGSPFSIRVSEQESESSYDAESVKDEFSQNNYYKLKSETSVTKNGVAGIRLEFEADNQESANIVYYFFNKDNLVYAITINNNGFKPENGIDITKTGEEIYFTFSFL